MKLYLPGRTSEIHQFFNEALINDIKNIADETEFSHLANFEYIRVKNETKKRGFARINKRPQ